MVLTEIDVTVPASTLKTDPVVVEQELPFPVITRVNVLIPKGVQATTRMALFYGESQKYPYRKGEWLTGNGESLRDTPLIDLGEPKPVINIRGYNKDPDHSHTFYWRISTEKGYTAYWRKALTFIARHVRRIV